MIVSPNYSFKNTFHKDNRNPDPKVNEPSLVQYTVNALAIALNMPWKNAVEDLVAEAHKLCIMPEDQKCVRGMLEKNGFVLQPGSSKSTSVDELCSLLNDRCKNGETVISTSNSKRHGCYATAFLPDEDGKYSIYGARDCRLFRVVNVWIRWPDGMDHSPVNRRKCKTTKRPSTRKEAASHDCFRFTQQNPEGNYIGDCVIRGLSSAMGITWHEAVDGLIRCTDYSRIIINTTEVFSKFLADNGYVKHKQLRSNGRCLKGNAFCEEMTKKYQHGERIFAFSGRSHVVAVMPTLEDGKYNYYIEDTWDSSGTTIGEYWVENLNHKAQSLAKKNIPEITFDFKVGQTIEHPKFGIGHIEEILKSGVNAILVVEFSEVGVKKLGAKWVDEHCPKKAA